MFGQLDVTLRALSQRRRTASAPSASRPASCARLPRAASQLVRRRTVCATTAGAARGRSTTSAPLSCARSSSECARRVCHGDRRGSVRAQVAVAARPVERHKVWQIVRVASRRGRVDGGQAKRAVLKVPPMIDECDVAAAQDKLIEHGKRGLIKTKHVYLLEGLALCGRAASPCRDSLGVRQPKRTNGNPSPAAYVCRARKLRAHRRGPLRGADRAAADLDAAVWDERAARPRSPGLARDIERTSPAAARIAAPGRRT